MDEPRGRGKLSCMASRHCHLPHQARERALICDTGSVLVVIRARSIPNETVRSESRAGTVDPRSDKRGRTSLKFSHPSLNRRFWSRLTSERLALTRGALSWG
jgi:hypothetical protein